MIENIHPKIFSVAFMLRRSLW